MRLVEFRRYLDDTNALRVGFELDRGQVTRFMVQLECRFAEDNTWIPVVRYDTAHGFAHCDQLHPYDEATKITVSTQNYNEALTYAMNDLDEKWLTYRKRYETWLNRN